MLVIKYLHWPSLGETLDRFSSVDKFKFKQNLCTIYAFQYPVSNTSPPLIGKFFQTLIINICVNFLLCEREYSVIVGILKIRAKKKIISLSLP